MKAKIEVVVEQDETATEQLARGVEMADDSKGTIHDEIKKEVELALETEYDDAEVRFVEEIN